MSPAAPRWDSLGGCRTETILDARGKVRAAWTGMEGVRLSQPIRNLCQYKVTVTAHTFSRLGGHLPLRLLGGQVDVEKLLIVIVPARKPPLRNLWGWRARRRGDIVDIKPAVGGSSERICFRHLSRRANVQIIEDKG
jgi:hypothetical protein